jgi:hypothetical protein
MRWNRMFRGFSLLDQGVLDMPCCPLLLVNGKDDLQNAYADITLALEHGDPKTARIYPGGHMGGDMKTIRDVIAEWLSERLLGSPDGRRGCQRFRRPLSCSRRVTRAVRRASAP